MEWLRNKLLQKFHNAQVTGQCLNLQLTNWQKGSNHEWVIIFKESGVKIERPTDQDYTNVATSVPGVLYRWPVGQKAVEPAVTRFPAGTASPACIHLHKLVQS